MKLLHRGVAFELADDDPRVAVIETLVFGRPLPPPLPMPPAPEPPAPPPAIPEALPIVIRPAVRAFWNELRDIDRHEILFVCEKPQRVQDVEKALGYVGHGLASRHAVIARRAAHWKLGKVIRATGRGRAARRFFVEAELAEQFRALAGERVGKS